MNGAFEYCVYSLNKKLLKLEPMSYSKPVFPVRCWKAFHSLGQLVDSMLQQALRFDTKEYLSVSLEITLIAFTAFLQVYRWL